MLFFPSALNLVSSFNILFSVRKVNRIVHGLHKCIDFCFLVCGHL